MNPGELLPLWDIVEDRIVTTRGSVFGGAELFGPDPTHIGDDAWNTYTEGLSLALRRLPEGTALQFVVEHRAIRPDELARMMHVDPDALKTHRDPFSRQRLWRYRHLLKGNIRRRRLFVFWGWRAGLSRKEFRQPSKAAFRRQMARTDGLGEDLRSALQRADIHMRTLSGGEIEALYYDWLHPDGGRGPIKPTVGGLSLRERLIADNVSWDPHHVRVGRTGFKVLAAKGLPEQVHGAIWETVSWRHQRDDGSFGAADVDFDFRIVVNVHVPSSWWSRQFLNLRRNMSRSQMAGGGDTEDAEVAEAQFTNLKKDVAAGSSLINVGMQVVVSGPDRKTLRTRADKMARTLGGIDLPMYEESLAHHTELFKSLPGMLGTWDRWMQVTNVEAADILPKSTYSHGDPDPSLMMELSATGEPFGVTLRSPDRATDNFLLLGGSGAGKSVYLNMVLAYEVLFGPKAGRLLAIDYASPDKSSLLVAAQVFGGDYIPIRSDGRRINPFPSPKQACESDGKTVRPLVLAFLVDLGKILFHNTEQGKTAGLYSALIQRAVRQLYAHWGKEEAPIYSDFFVALKELTPSDDDEAGRLRDLTKLVESSVIDGPEAGLFNGPTTAKTEGDFLVYDLHGLEGLDDRIKTAVVLVATHLVRGMAFDGRPDRLKTIIFEEATALMKLGMRDLIEELLTTARAHGTSVGVINQVYEKFRRSGLADTITANTHMWSFLSHGSAKGAINPIIQDFGLTERQAQVLRGVRYVKKRFSQVMTVMQTSTPRGVEETTSKATLWLSPFDYWLVTSSAEDRALQRSIKASEPDLSPLDIVEILARRAS